MHLFDFKNGIYMKKFRTITDRETRCDHVDDFTNIENNPSNY